MLCQDEAGPYQAIPQPGASWQPETKPARQPHEYIRGGAAKLLTLFRPVTGALRAKAVTSGTNAVLHPWLMTELAQVLAALPAVEAVEAERPALAQWQTWLGHPPITSLPPLRAVLVWDNLAGHLSWSIVRWLFQHGAMPLYTPLSGSWLTMAESIPRILKQRARWAAADAAPGDHRCPGGDCPRRASRSPRSSGVARAPSVACARRHARDGSGACAPHPIRRCRAKSRYGYTRAK
ncbi:MAG: transposase [Chloroflexi bacterium]|nr:transposase [Chloroflexota bacterium]